MLHVSPGQAKALNNYSRRVLFTVAFEGDWTEILDANGITTYRFGIRGHGGALSDIVFDGTTFTANYHYTTREPNEKAIAEVEALADKWKSEGREDLADNLLIKEVDDTGYATYLIDCLNDTVEHVKQVVIKNPTFLAYRVWVGPRQETYNPRIHDSGGPLTRKMMTNMYEKIKARGL